MAIADIGNFVKVDFTNTMPPAINATNFDALENRMQDIDDALSGSPIYLTSTAAGIGAAPVGAFSVTKTAGSAIITLVRSNDTTSGSQGAYGFMSYNGYYTCAISATAAGTSDSASLVIRASNASTFTSVYDIPETARFTSMGNFGLKATSAGTSGVGVFVVGIGTEPSTSPANTIQIYAKDSSAGSANATLSFRTEQAVEDIGTFTADKKLRVWINGVEYHISLDAV